MRSAKGPSGTLADLTRRDLVGDETSTCALHLPLFRHLPKLSADSRPMARIPSLGRAELVVGPLEILFRNIAPDKIRTFLSDKLNQCAGMQ